jgi:hypothetical protein
MPVASSTTGSGGPGAVAYVAAKSSSERRLNVFSQEPKQVGREMDLTADQRPRTDQHVYHVSISYKEAHDEISDQEMISDAEAFLEKRGLGGHQAYIATHRDEDHPHVHIVANRVSVDGEELWRDSFDYYRNMDALREIEAKRDRISPEEHRRDESEPKIADWKYQRFKRTGEEPFGQLVQSVAGEEFAEAETWEELQQRLSGQGLTVQRKGSGGIVTDGEEEAPLSEVARKWSFNKLDERFPDQYRPQKEYQQSHGTEREDGPEGRAEARGGEGAASDQARDRGSEQAGRGGGRPGRGASGHAKGRSGGSEHGRGEDRRSVRAGREGRQDDAGAPERPSDNRAGGTGGRERAEHDQGTGDEGEAGAGDLESSSDEFADLDPLGYRWAEPIDASGRHPDDRDRDSRFAGIISDTPGDLEHGREGVGDLSGADKEQSGDERREDERSGDEPEVTQGGQSSQEKSSQEKSRDESESGEGKSEESSGKDQSRGRDRGRDRGGVGR